MRNLHHMVTAALLSATCSNAIAVDSPLPAGKPAGIKQAAYVGDTWKAVVVLGAIAAVVILATQGGGYDSRG